MWPQIIYLLLIALGLGVWLSQYGKPNTGKHGMETPLATIITLALLYWGGFFDPILK